MTNAIFFGASSVEGHGASAPEHRFSTIVCNTLGWREVNLGIGGTTVIGRDAEGMIIDENSGIARVPDVLDAEPEFVFILYGANDFAQSKPLGSPEQFQQGTFVWDFDTLLRGLLDELEPEQIVLSTSFYRRDAETPNGQHLTLQDYNRAITELGARHHIRVLDAFANSEIGPNTFDALCFDDAHLNDRGYQTLAAFYIEALQQKPNEQL